MVQITIRAYEKKDLEQMGMLWNSIVEEGDSFPQKELLRPQEAEAFFAGQTYTGVAEEAGEIIGLYILHPNNVGRCGHIANASYGVKQGQRGKKIGARLVKDSLEQAKAFSYRILQFNAVVATNHAAIHLYEALGFQKLGMIPGGFEKKDGSFADIIPFYRSLD